jgi:nucleoside-diphosphate-sugar epimerase
MSKKTAIVAGSLGIVGQAIIRQLRVSGDWHIVAISRRDVDLGEGVHCLSIDLLDSADCKKKLRTMGDVTHVFFCAYAARATLAEEVAPNLAMVVNLVSTLEQVAPQLAHIQLMQGSKWYGNHLGAYRTPARENDARHMPPNFYYAQQDWLEERQRGKRWTWSALRPHCVCGYSVGSPMNHLMAISLYASISREIGLPLRFPGTPLAYAAMYQFTDSRLLARAMVWAATTTACENRAFNITNGEPDRWQNIWPDLARSFGMELGAVQHINLAQMMADKEPLWAGMRQQYGLLPHTLEELVNWKFADWAYSSSFDQVSSLAEARRAGWNEVLDADTMFQELVAGLVEKRVIPPQTKTKVLTK